MQLNMLTGVKRSLSLVMLHMVSSLAWLLEQDIALASMHAVHSVMALLWPLHRLVCLWREDPSERETGRKKKRKINIACLLASAAALFAAVGSVRHGMTGFKLSHTERTGVSFCPRKSTHGIWNRASPCTVFIPNSLLSTRVGWLTVG